MQQLNDKNHGVWMLKLIKVHETNALWFIGLAIGLLGIFVVTGWLQYCLLLLGSVCFVTDRLLSYMKDVKPDK